MAKKYTVEKHTTVEYIVLVHAKAGIKEVVAKCNYKEYALQIRDLMTVFEEQKHNGSDN